MKTIKRKFKENAYSEVTIQLFNEVLYRKLEDRKKTKLEREACIKELKELDVKEDYCKRTGDYEKVIQLSKEKQDKLKRIEEIDNLLNHDDLKVSDDEHKQFNAAYNEEANTINSDYKQQKKVVDEAIKNLTEAYKQLAVLKVEAGRRLSRKEYVDSNINGDSITTIFRGVLPPSAVYQKDDTTEEAIARKVYQQLDNANGQAFKEVKTNRGEVK
ncbi:hypothetical protein MKY53_05520 [Macrococcus sp. FSL R5-0951]